MYREHLVYVKASGADVSSIQRKHPPPTNIIESTRPALREPCLYLTQHCKNGPTIYHS
jgi:hypothetical protein